MYQWTKHCPLTQTCCTGLTRHPVSVEDQCQALWPTCVPLILKGTHLNICLSSNSERCSEGHHFFFFLCSDQHLRELVIDLVPPRFKQLNHSPTDPLPADLMLNGSQQDAILKVQLKSVQKHPQTHATLWIIA